MNIHAGDTTDDGLLSDDEKQELLDTLNDTVNDLQKENDRLENIKTSSKDFFKDQGN